MLHGSFAKILINNHRALYDGSKTKAGSAFISATAVKAVSNEKLLNIRTSFLSPLILADSYNFPGTHDR